MSWEKFNGRKDVKNPTWFRVEYRLMEDPDFYEFTHEELVVWLYMMAQACRKASSEIKLHFAHAHATKRLSRKAILSASKKLQSLQLITIIGKEYGDEVEGAYAGFNVTCTSPDATGQDRTGQDVTGQDETGQTSYEGVHRPPSREKSLGSKIFDAYRSAYVARWKNEPVRNARVNSQCTQLGQRLGEDALDVVRFYVLHNDSMFIRDMHPIGLCLAKAEGLHTQWKLGHAITSADVRIAERRITNQGALQEAFRIVEGQES